MQDKTSRITINNTTKQWKDLNFINGATITSGNYYLVLWGGVEGNNWPYVYGDNTTGTASYFVITFADNDDDWNFWGTKTNFTFTFSIYATYTEGGGETSRRIIITQ